MCVTWDPFYLSTPAMTAFTQEYLKAAKVYPGEITSMYYMSALALVAAIQKAGSTDPEQLVNALENLQFVRLSVR